MANVDDFSEIIYVRHKDRNSVSGRRPGRLAAASI
jgi:hypothetical protein